MCSALEREGEVDEKSGAETGGALRQPAIVGIDRHRASDVEMRPRHIANKLGEEERRRDRSTPRAADVAHVGDIAVEQLAVRLAAAPPCPNTHIDELA